MNGDDLLNNHYQLSLAQEAVHDAFAEITADYERLSEENIIK